MKMSFRRRAPAEPRPGRRRSGWETVRLFAFVFLLAWAFRSFVFAPFNIPSGSMLPTLYIGDYVMVSKWPYGVSKVSFPFGFPSFDGRIASRLPERGDIVVFRAPDGASDVIKRVIGLPGDTVALRGGMLVLNGRPLPREPEGVVEIPVSDNSPCRVAPGATTQYGGGGSTCLYPAYRETLPSGGSYLVLDQVDNPIADDFASIRVPEGHVFLMGDNRDDSLDSRFSQIIGGLGPVPVENLIGRASFLFWSTDGSASYWQPWTWFTALRGSRIGSSLHSSER